MNRPAAFLLLLWIAAPASALAAGLSSLDELKALANESTLLLAQEQFEGGFQILKPHWPVPAAELLLVIRQTSADWPRIRAQFGKSQGIRYLGEQRLSSTFIRYSYLHRFENGWGQWQFTFQQFQDSWLVDGVAFVEGPPLTAE